MITIKEVETRLSDLRRQHEDLGDGAGSFEAWLVLELIDRERAIFSASDAIERLKAMVEAKR